MAGRKRKIRDRRRLGVNFFSVLRAARKVSSDPKFEPTTKEDLSEAILEEIMGEKLASARMTREGIDWDGLLAFIEKLIPLIMKLMALFGM